jgi:hypothetical protein
VRLPLSSLAHDAREPLVDPAAYAARSAFFCIPWSGMQNFCIFSHVFVTVRTGLQSASEIRKLSIAKEFGTVSAVVIAVFPSWTSPVRIRSPALDGTPQPNAT